MGKFEFTPMMKRYLVKFTFRICVFFQCAWFVFAFGCESLGTGEPAACVWNYTDACALGDVYGHYAESYFSGYVPDDGTEKGR